MEVISKEAKFTVTVVGETTGQNFSGIFRVKNRLSHREQLLRDETRRQILGSAPDAASPRAMNQALVFSEIAAHLIEAPKWWQLADGGLDLEDDNVVAAVYDGVVKTVSDFQESIRKQLDTDKKAVREALPPEEALPLTTTTSGVRPK